MWSRAIWASTIATFPALARRAGFGFALLSFVSAVIRPGFEVVAEAIGLEDAVRRADVIITGEGRLDAQTLEGKGPAGVAELARKHGKKCYAIVGQLEETPGLSEHFAGVSILGFHGLENTAAFLRERACELGEQL